MNIAVIFAGGVGTRMHTNEKPKQFLELFNKPIIIYTLEHFEYTESIDKIVIVCIEGWIEYLKKLLIKFGIKKVVQIVSGGTTGQKSIYNGLIAAKSVSNNERSIVLIHDGVRPLINTDLIIRNIEAVKKYGSAITYGSVTETVVIDEGNDKIFKVVPRNQSKIAKAPQSFWLEDILASHNKAYREGRFNFIDSCTMMKFYGMDMHLVKGPDENIKITTPVDYYVMRAIIQEKEDRQIYI